MVDRTGVFTMEVVRNWHLLEIGLIGFANIWSLRRQKVRNRLSIFWDGRRHEEEQIWIWVYREIKAEF